MNRRSMHHPPQLKQTTRNTRYHHMANKYHSQFGAAKCKVIRRGRAQNVSKTVWRNTGRSLNLQIPRRSHKQQRQPIKPHNKDKKEGQRGQRRYPCRIRQHWIQRNKGESHMANGGCHNHPNNNLLMWGVVHQQRREQKTTKYLQRSIGNQPLPTPRDPNHNSPQRNRKFTNIIYHKKEANPTSKEDKWNEGKVPNKRHNQNHT